MPRACPEVDGGHFVLILTGSGVQIQGCLEEEVGRFSGEHGVAQGLWGIQVRQLDIPNQSTWSQLSAATVARMGDVSEKHWVGRQG